MAPAAEMRPNRGLPFSDTLSGSQAVLHNLQSAAWPQNSAHFGKRLLCMRNGAESPAGEYRVHAMASSEMVSAEPWIKLINILES